MRMGVHRNSIVVKEVNRMVKVTLITATWCNSCPSAKKIWDELKSEHDFEYEIVDLISDKGKELIAAHSIKGVPANIVDGKFLFSGVPTRSEALEAIGA